MRSGTELSQFLRLLLSTLSIKLSYIVSSVIFICCLVVGIFFSGDEFYCIYAEDRPIIRKNSNDNFKLNLYRDADNFCLFFCEYCIVNFL